MTKIVFLTEREANLLKQFTNGCESKAAYRSSARAELARDATMKKCSSVRAQLAGTRPYQCQFCGLWHLGHGK